MKRISTEAIDEIFESKDRFPISNYFAFALQLKCSQKAQKAQRARKRLMVKPNNKRQLWHLH